MRGEFEACPAGVAFGHMSCTTASSPGWQLASGLAPDRLLAHTLTGLANNTLYRWRARVLHAPATGAIPIKPPHGPWRRPTAQSVEADIRLPEPGVLVALAAGAALVAGLARRRSRVR